MTSTRVRVGVAAGIVAVLLAAGLLFDGGRSGGGDVADPVAPLADHAAAQVAVRYVQARAAAGAAADAGRDDEARGLWGVEWDLASEGFRLNKGRQEWQDVRVRYRNCPDGLASAPTCWPDVAVVEAAASEVLVGDSGRDARVIVAVGYVDGTAGTVTVGLVVEDGRWRVAEFRA